MARTQKKRPAVVTGQVAMFISREEFRRRFDANFADPAFAEAREAIGKLEAIAWDGYKEGRKAPFTRKAGRGFADPDYDLSVEWKATRDRLLKIDAHRKSAESKSRVLVICGSPRNDGTCPGEMSKTFRLAQITQRTLQRERVEVDLLDLSRVTNEYRAQDSPLQGLCIDGDAPLPLAVQLLSESCARADQRLDGGDLRALDGGARHPDRDSGALVSIAEPA